MCIKRGEREVRPWGMSECEFVLCSADNEGGSVILGGMGDLKISIRGRGEGIRRGSQDHRTTQYSCTRVSREQTE